MCKKTICATSFLAASLTAAMPVAAQTSARSDDPGPRSVTSTARSVALPYATVADRSARDAIRLTGRDYASIATPVVTPVVTPYRSTPSADVAPDGFSMRIPGTGLDLTNGSLSIRRNDARNARGVSFSVQLTY